MIRKLRIKFVCIVMYLLKRRIREIRPDALLMGEVWEDASNKIAYDVRRRYFVDGVLDSCMNYPFRTAILNFLPESTSVVKADKITWSVSMRITDFVFRP